jgi:Raf kinase inhibitor-like YbhB/YbcL family protein
MGPAAALASIVFTLASPAFGNGDLVPARYTCDGANISPPLRWETPPRGTKSFSLSITDTDSEAVVHWTASGIAPSVRSLRAGVHLRRQGVNAFGKRGYSGPCPPRGATHHYVIGLWALDGHGRVLGEAGMIVRYARR